MRAARADRLWFHFFQRKSHVNQYGMEEAQFDNTPKGGNMKSKMLVCTMAMTLFTALTFPAHIAAQRARR